MAVVDEILVKIRASAEGVKQGVNTAKKELGSLKQAEKDLEKKIKIAVDNSEIKRLMAELKTLNQERNDLQRQIKFDIPSDDVVSIKEELKEVGKEIKKLENAKILPDIGISGTEQSSQIQKELDGWLDKKKELEGSLELQIELDAENAQNDLKDLNTQIYSLEKEIQVKVTGSGVEDMNAKLKEVKSEIQDVEAESRKAESAMTKMGVAGAAAFYGIAKAVGSGMGAYRETVEVQTKLNHLMQLNLDATGAQVQEVIALTKEYEKVGVISAKAQQAGAQELSTYFSQVESLKALLPVLNDITAQQHGYNAAASQAAGIATMLGKIMEGETGSLKRYGFSFNEAQEEILKFGTEAERVATLVEVIGESVGGTNEALGNTDFAAMENLKNETQAAADAFGEALTPAVGAAAELLGSVMSKLTTLVDNNKALTASVTASGIAFSGFLIILKAVPAAMGLIKTASAALTASNAALAVSLGPIGIALIAASGLIAGTVTAYKNAQAEAEAYAEKMDMLNEQIERYNKLRQQGANLENYDDYSEMAQNMEKNAQILKKVVDAYEEEIKRLEANNVDVNNWHISLLTFVEETIEQLGGDVDEINMLLESIGVDIDLTPEWNELSLEELKSAYEALQKVTKEQIREVDALDNALHDFAQTAQQATKSFSDYTNEINNLNGVYNTLAQKQELNYNQILNLINTYPAVARLIAENVDWRENLIDVIHDEMIATRQQAAETLNAENEMLAAEKNRVDDFLRGYQSEAEGYAIMTANKKKILADFVNSIAQSAEDVASGNLSSISTDVIALNGIEMLQRLVDYSTDLGNRIDENKNKIAALNNMPVFQSVSKATSGAAKSTEELNAQLKEAMENYKKLAQLEDYTATQRLQALQAIKGQFAKSDYELEYIELEIRPVIKEINNAEYRQKMEEIADSLNGVEDLIDFNGVKEKIDDLKDWIIETFGEGTNTAISLLEEVGKAEIAILERDAARAESILSDSVDGAIGEIKRLIAAKKDLDGLNYINADGEIETFRFTIQDEIQMYQEAIVANRDRIAEIEAMEGRLTTELYKELQQRLKDNENFYETIRKLRVKAYQEQQADMIKATKEDINNQIKSLDKVHKVDLDNLKKANTARIAEIRKYHDAQVKLAQDAANEEIKIYEDRIRAIDALLKQESRDDTDEAQLDKIRRLEEQLAFEKDEYNKYELAKEIANEKADYEKRKRQEALQDERDDYRERINNVKDELALKKEALAEERDAAIEAAQASYEARVAFMEAETEKQKGELNQQLENATAANNLTYEQLLQLTHSKNTLYTEDTANYMLHLAEKTAAEGEFHKLSYEASEKNAEETTDLMTTVLENIISKFMEAADRFAEAGAAQGSAYVDAFNAQIDRMSSIVSGGGGGGGLGGGRGSSGGSYLDSDGVWKSSDGMSNAELVDKQVSSASPEKKNSIEVTIVTNSPAEVSKATAKISERLAR